MGGWIAVIVFAVGSVVSIGLRAGWIHLWEPDPIPAHSIALSPQAPGAAAERPEVQVIYAVGPRLQMSPVIDAIRRSRVMEVIAEGVNASFHLRHRILVRVKPCGFINAVYHPEDHSIDFCEEFVPVFEAAFSELRSPERFRSAVLGATQFFLLHEMAHALIHQLDLAIIGGEEDAADALATYLTVASGAEEVALSGADSFAFLSLRANARVAFWDEHSLSEQRFYNILCWVHGSNPRKFAYLTTTGLLPQERAVRCPDEFTQTQRSATRLLSPYLKR